MATTLPWWYGCTHAYVDGHNTKQLLECIHLTFSLYFSPKIVYSSQNSLVYFGGTRLQLLVIGPMKAQLLINYYNFLTVPLQTRNRSWRHGTSSPIATLTRNTCFTNMSSNQIGPEVAVSHRHVHCNVVRMIHLKHYDVTSFQFKYPRGERGALTSKHWLYHGNYFAVYHDVYPVTVLAHVHLRVYVVPPSNWHGHSPVAVRHTSGKVTGRRF